jgi:membrane-associated phospholipid phosphatase
VKGARRAAWLLATAVTTLGMPARAEPLRWEPHWGRAQPAEYAAAVTAGVMAVLIDRMPVVELDWGVSEPDEAARRALRLDAPRSRLLANQVSDAMFYGLTFYPLAEAVLVAAPRDGRTAWQMLALDGQVLALAALSSITLQHVSGRSRPFLRYCTKNPAPEHARDCTESGRDEHYQSFPSGHTVLAAAGAGLVCAHHRALPLYGGGAPDAAACIAAASATLVQGTLRVMADRHYLTDVVLGLGLGFGLGYGIPMAARYGNERPAARSSAPSSAAPLTFSMPLYASVF